MRLIYLPKAIDDLDRLHAFLAPKNPKAAATAIQKIRDGAKSLTDVSPERGTPIGHSGYRQLFVRFGRGIYVIRYRVSVSLDAVVVVRIWHGRERRN